ncbi:MAG: HesA/MoeB/ThiF family protein [Bacteroidales bacterium]|nr:HesA/MoeB/ThiF family protein [Bacteroidales bacterium]
MTVMNKNEAIRYNRQLIIPAVGEKGQEKLGQARVLVVGAGGLGSPVLMYLAAAGVGTIGIVDSDAVDLSNLQRQILYTTEDIGLPKAETAAKKLMALNPGITLKTYSFRLTNENVNEVLTDYDIAVDCCDNFPTRYILSDAAKSADKPMVYGAVYQFFGQVSVFNYNNGPSYRTLFPEEVKAAEMAAGIPPGVIGVLPGMIGSIEAAETIKIILGEGEVLSGRLLQIDALNFRVEIISF